jgi:hypothetical protein
MASISSRNLVDAVLRVERKSFRIASGYPSALTLARSRSCAQRWSLAAAGDNLQIVRLP